jgi:hypothetical protein
LSPAWDPDTAATSSQTFALEVWVMASDGTPAHPITQLSTAGAHYLTYPTDVDGDTLYITSAPQSGVASNLPGAIYRYRVAPL